MSVGVEVDALALMLDGVLDGCTRFDRWNVGFLERPLTQRGQKIPGAMTRNLLQPGMSEVAEAILELEAWADWNPLKNPDGAPEAMGHLADAAASRAGVYGCEGSKEDDALREAAALLRDGWRPRGWRAS